MKNERMKLKLTLRSLSPIIYLLLIPVVILPAGCEPANRPGELELVGHRGATGFAPENTIPGFKKALEFDINSIEFDVVVSGDGKVVVSHEPWFRHDICLQPDGSTIAEEEQMNHLIYEMSYEEISEYDCGSLQRPGFPEQETMSAAKPLMMDAIREIEAFREENGYAEIDYNVEIKSNPDWDNELQPEPGDVIRLVYNELQELGLMERIKIFAFDTRILNELQRIDSTVTQVYLIPGSQPDVADNLSKLTHIPDVYAPNHSLVGAELVAQIHSNGMRLIPWTVNRYEDMVRLVDMGVDGIISDYPNHFEKLKKHAKGAAGDEF